MRAALYLRVSTTDGQTTENQRLALIKVAGHRGWEIVHTYEDAGISGAKGRDQRPAFNQISRTPCYAGSTCACAGRLTGLEGQSCTSLAQWQNWMRPAGRSVQRPAGHRQHQPARSARP
jgi:hypothetical protein